MRGSSVIAGLRPLLRQHRGAVVLLLVLGSLSALAEGLGISLFIPLLDAFGPEPRVAATGGDRFRRILGSLFEGLPRDQLLGAILATMLGLIIMKNGLAFLAHVVFARLDASVSHGLRAEVHAGILARDPRWVEKHQTGDLLHLLEGQTWQVAAALQTLISILIRIVTIAVFTTALLLISWRLTLLVGAALLIISTAVRLMTRAVDQASVEAQSAWKDLYQRMLEVLRGLPTIHAFSREAYEHGRFASASSRTANLHRRIQTLSALVGPASEIMIALVLVTVLWLAIREPGSLAGVVTFIFILYRLQPHVQQLDRSRVELRAGGAPVEAVRTFLEAAAGKRSGTGGRPWPGLRAGLCFRNVSFSYEPGCTPALHALQALDFTIPARRTTAIVGPSGAGKSTLVKLLLRFYEPTSGSIEADGIPLGELGIDAWRDHLAVVSQDAHLFHDSILENIRYGRLDASDADVRESARRAHAIQFIDELPEGLATEVGDQGVRLSGGQRQRVALARALVRTPDLLILDEATNALDGISQDLVQEALDELGGQCTILVIAHRLVTIERADQILVLESGQLRECGDYASLVAADGLFARLRALEESRFGH